jgi:hypothetical protein
MPAPFLLFLANTFKRFQASVHKERILNKGSELLLAHTVGNALCLQFPLGNRPDCEINVPLKAHRGQRSDCGIYARNLFH